MDDVGGLVGAEGVIVEDWDEEAGLVGDVKVAATEDPVEAVNEGLVAAGHLDEPAHVLRGVDGVGPDVALIEEVGPGAANDEVRVGPGAVGVAGTEEAMEAFGGHVLVPEVLEVVGAAGVEGGFFLVAEAAGYFGDGEVVVAVLGDA